MAALFQDKNRQTPQCLSFFSPYSVMKIAGHWPAYRY